MFEGKINLANTINTFLSKQHGIIAYFVLVTPVTTAYQTLVSSDHNCCCFSPFTQLSLLPITNHDSLVGGVD